MSRRWVFVAALTAAGCTHESRAGARSATVVATLSGDFRLGPADTASFAGPPTATVRFLRVVEDGRCPRGASCSATLPVTVEIEIVLAGMARREQLAILDRDVGEPRFQGMRSCTPVGSFVLRLRDVVPWPEHGGKTKDEDYRAILVIERSCGSPSR